MFPPSHLSLPDAAENYARYAEEPHHWILSRFVLSSKDLMSLPASKQFPLTVLADRTFVWADARVKSVETKEVFAAHAPTYCEIPIDDLSALDAVRDARVFAKIRTGGLSPDAIPATDAIAAFLVAAAHLKIPFKATAGLHHPIRAVRALTYEKDSPTAVMHGFINLFVASALAWSGSSEAIVRHVLSEEDPKAFAFDTELRWRDTSLTAVQVADARRDFAHSFGSCSFVEPVNELHELDWLPC
jgi:hypothetical protein